MSMDLASLALKIDSSEVPKGVAALDDLTEAGKRTEGQAKKTAAETKKSADAAAALAAQAENLRAKFDPLYAAEKKYADALILADKALRANALSQEHYNDIAAKSKAEMEGQIKKLLSLKNANDAASEGMTKTSGTGRILGQQLSQVAQQAAAGTNVLQALAIQLPDIAVGMGAAGGAARGFAGFLGGPWGIAITAGIAVLVPLVSKLWEAGDAANASRRKMEEFSKDALSLLGRVPNGWDADVNKAKKDIFDIGLQIKKLEGDTSGNRAGRLQRVQEIGDLKARRRELEQGLFQARAVETENARIAASEKAVTAARREGNKALHDAESAAKRAARAREEYNKSLLGRAESGMLAGQIFTELSKINIKVDLPDGLKGLRDQFDAAAVAETGRQRLREAEDYMDRRSRDRFMKAANDFADIVGGRFGDAISRLAAVLDRFSPKLTASLGKAIEGISSGLSSVLGSLGVGASIGTGVAGVMKSIGIKTSTTGAAIGGALGSFAGPLGTVAGSILGGVIGGLLKKVKKGSQTIELIAGDAVKTSLVGNSSKLKAAASAMADSLIGTLTGIADQFNATLGDGIKISIGKRDKTFRVDLQGLGRTKNMPKFDTEEAAIAFAIQEVIKQGALLGLRAGTETLLKGEGDLQAQLQKAMAFEGVFKELASRANPARSAIEGISTEFRKLADIFDEAGASAADYAQLQELMALRQKEAIQSAFEPIRSTLDDLKSKADTAGEAVKSSFAEVLSREADATETYKSMLREQMSAFSSAAQQLRTFSGTIFGEQSQTGLRSKFNTLAVAAKGGDLNAANDLAGVGSDLAKSIRENATDRVSMLRELARVKSATDAAASVAEGRASAAEQQLKVLGDVQLTIEQAAAEMQTAKAAADQARAQMALLTELKDNDLSFTDAVAEYEKAKAERDGLMRDITAAGFAGLIEVQKQTGAQMIAALSEASALAAKALADAAAANEAARLAQDAAAVKAANDNQYAGIYGRIPSFASGGEHSGGLRRVGENGPELEVTGPSRIFTAEQIAQAMGSSRETTNELKAMREEMNAALVPIVFSINQLARDIHGSIKQGILTVRADDDQPLPVEVAA